LLGHRHNPGLPSILGPHGDVTLDAGRWLLGRGGDESQVANNIECRIIVPIRDNDWFFIVTKPSIEKAEILNASGMGEKQIREWENIKISTLALSLMAFIYLYVLSFLDGKMKTN